MKRKLFLLGLTALPLALLTAAREVVSWRPHLIGTDPDGACNITWSTDGRVVQLDPQDTRQNLGWGTFYLDARAESVEDKAVIPFSGPRLALEPIYDDKANPAIKIHSGTKDLPLQNAPWDLFGFDMDSTSFGWRFQDSRFSDDWKVISIVSAGAVYTWSTSTGKLLRQVRFDNSKNVSPLFAALSPDCRLVVARMDNRFNGLFVRGGVFDTRTGRKLFDISRTADLAVGFSPEGSIFWTSSRTSLVFSDDGQSLHFFDARSGQLLWQDLCFSRSGIKFSPQQQTVVISGEKGLEVRDMRTGKLEQTLAHPAQDVQSFAPSPDGSQLWASYANGQIWSWRLR